MSIVNAVIQGILLGGLYALFAAGLSLMFGVMRLVNLAHGAFAVLAAYGALLIVRTGALNPIAALLIIVPAMAVLGFVVQRFILQRTLGTSPLPALLVTFGLSIIIENTLLLTVTADQQRLNLGSFDTAAIALPGGIRIGAFPLAVFVFALVVLALLSLVLSRTQYGRLVRAVSDDPGTVQLNGADPKLIYGFAAAIAFGLVAVAGVASGVQTSFSPSSGSLFLIFAFEAVIIGGLGSLWGTMLGAVVLGIAQTVGAAIAPAQQILIGHLVFLVFLAFLPGGITRQKALR
ncbi:branched-chain amino acid ABC transporter permease [Naasia lichenicola]|uniref:Branched-chain amino acid ABC transporter permease n=1 Tax=Naasia lichenicola TaxID=2565933 RepID=A0A4S4FMD0_9MICO|nr:branched-chain amino acid ABC transporter permease [Naasia lichenicola]THG31559.1 branched-chain amino acid ABC transporter permease [Naasia lichenicola]